MRLTVLYYTISSCSLSLSDQKDSLAHQS